MPRNTVFIVRITTAYPSNQAHLLDFDDRSSPAPELKIGGRAGPAMNVWDIGNMVSSLSSPKYLEFAH